MTIETINLRQMGKRIRRLRLEKGLSQEDVAHPAFTAAYMSHVEHGKRRPSHAALSHIADRLGVTAEQLLSGRDPHEDLRLEIEIQSAIADLHRGEAAGVPARLKEALAEAEKAKHERAALRAQEGLGQALYRLRKYDEALGVFRRAAERSAELADSERTTAIVGWSRCLFHLGKVRDALHLLESHKIELLRADPPDPTALLQVNAALIPPYFASGLLEQAQQVAKEGWELAPVVPDLEHRACLYVNRAGLLLTQGEPREALASLSLAEDLFRQLGWHAEAVKVLLARAYALSERGDLTAAETLFRQVLEDPNMEPTDSERGQALVHLAQVRRQLRDPRDGLELARQVVKLAGSELKSIAAEANREAALCLQDLHDVEGALRYLRKALKLFQEVANREDIAKTARLIGDLLLKKDPKKAAAAYREGLAAMAELR